MPPQRSSWYAIAREGEPTLGCAACHQAVDVGQPASAPPLDSCPACGVASAYLTWKGRLVQILLTKAPPGLVNLLRPDGAGAADWFAALEPLMDDLYTASAPHL